MDKEWAQPCRVQAILLFHLMGLFQEKALQDLGPQTSLQVASTRHTTSTSTWQKETPQQRISEPRQQTQATALKLAVQTLQLGH